MKILKRIGLVLLILLAIPFVAALFLPKEAEHESEIVINKPVEEVFEYIKYVKNQDNFGVWQLLEPDTKKTFEGTDGTVGFKYSWEGEKLGKGSQTIVHITEGERLETELDFGFGEPSRSHFTVQKIAAEQTKVTWGIKGKSPYPWNFFSLFYDLGKDFEQGLKNLKEIMENNSPESDNTSTMEKLQFKINVNAPAEKVYRTMLGIDDIKTYEQWTEAFNPTSSYEGSWEKGSKIYFIGMDEDGKRGGMVSRIAENLPNQFVSIYHYGILDGDTEITEGEEVEKWAGGYENYTFEERNEGTTVTIELETTQGFVEYMNTTCPQALEILKEICEK